MAFSGVINRGYSTRNTSGTTLSITPNANIAVDKLLIVVVTWNNSGSVTLSDSQNNTWVRAQEVNNINKGSAVFYTKVTTQITTSNSITATFNTTVTLAVVQASEVTIDTSQNIEYLAVSSSQNEHTFSGYTSRPYLHWGFCDYFTEVGNSSSNLPGTNYTEYVDRSASDGTNDILSAHGQYRIVTNTGDTVTTTAIEPLVTYEYTQQVVSFYEVSASTNVTATPIANAYTETLQSPQINLGVTETPSAISEIITLNDVTVIADALVIPDSPATHALLFLIDEYSPTIRFDYVHVIADVINFTETLPSVSVLIVKKETSLLGMEYSEDGSPWAKIISEDVLGISSDGSPFSGYYLQSPNVTIVPTTESYTETLLDVSVIIDIDVIVTVTLENLNILINNVTITGDANVALTVNDYSILQKDPTINLGWVESTTLNSFTETLYNPQINLGVTETLIAQTLTESLLPPQINLGWTESANLNSFTLTPQVVEVLTAGNIIIDLNDTGSYPGNPISYAETILSPTINVTWVETASINSYTETLKDPVIIGNAVVLADSQSYIESLPIPTINFGWTEIATLNSYTEVLPNVTIVGDTIVTVDSQSYIESLSSPQINYDWVEAATINSYIESLQIPTIITDVIVLAGIQSYTENLWSPQINLGVTNTPTVLPYTETLYSPQINLEWVEVATSTSFNLLFKDVNVLVDTSVTISIDPYPTYSENLINPQINFDWVQAATLNIFTILLHDVTAIADTIVPIQAVIPLTETLQNPQINLGVTETPLKLDFTESLQSPQINLGWVEIATLNLLTETLYGPQINLGNTETLVALPYTETLYSPQVNLDYVQTVDLITFNLTAQIADGVVDANVTVLIDPYPTYSESLMNPQINVDWTQIATLNIFTETLFDVTVTGDAIVVAGLQSYTEILPNVTINVDWTEITTINTFAETIQNVTINLDWVEVATTNNFTLTPQTVDVLLTSDVVVVISEAISYSITEQNPQINLDWIETYSVNTFTINLLDVTIIADFEYIEYPSAITYTELLGDVTVVTDQVITADLLTYNETLQNVTILEGFGVTALADSLSYSISVLDPDLSLGGTSGADITFFGQTWIPATDNATTPLGSATPHTIVPPSSMVSGQLVILAVGVRDNTAPAIVNAGGQTWNSETMNTNGTTNAIRMFWCIFNGTWSANPTFSTASSTQGVVAWMGVYNNINTGDAFDVNPTAIDFAATTSKTLTSFNTGVAKTWAHFIWCEQDDNALTPTSWTGPDGQNGPLHNHVGNMGGTDLGLFVLMKNMPTAGATQDEVVSTGADLGTGYYFSIISGATATTDMYVTADLLIYNESLPEVTIIAENLIVINETVIIGSAESYTITQYDPQINLGNTETPNFIPYTVNLNTVDTLYDYVTPVDSQPYTINLGEPIVAIEVIISQVVEPYIIGLLDPTIILDVVIPQNIISFTETINDVSIIIDVATTADPSTYDITLYNVSTTINETVLVDSIPYVITLQDVSVKIDAICELTLETYTELLISPTVNLDWTEVTTIQPYTITLNNPIVTIDIVCTPSTENLGISLSDPIIDTDWVESVSLIDFNLTLQDVTVLSTINYIYLADTINLTETILDITVTIEENVIVQVTNETYNLLLNNVNVIIDITIPVTLEPYIINLYDIAIFTEANIIIAESLNFLVSLPDVTVNWDFEGVVDNILYVISQSDVTIIGDSVSEIDTLLFDLEILPANAGDLEGIIRIDNLIYNIHTFYPRVDVGEVFRHDFRLKKKYIMHKK